MSKIKISGYLSYISDRTSPCNLQFVIWALAIYVSEIAKRQEIREYKPEIWFHRRYFRNLRFGLKFGCRFNTH